MTETLGNPVQLDGTGSSDPDGHVLTYVAESTAAGVLVTVQ